MNLATKHAKEDRDSQTYDDINVVHQVIKGNEREPGFEVRILGEVATRVAVLCMETLLHAKYIPEGWKKCPETQLGTLREVGRLAMVVQFEQR